MATIGRWGGIKFSVSKSPIRGFTGLTIKGSCETDDTTKGNQKYVMRKKGNPSEVNLTVVLNASLGCDVRSDALKLVSYANDGKKDYFYVGSKKLLSCMLMLVDATVNEVILGNNCNTWISSEVGLTMKQSDESDSSSGGSNKASVKRSNTKKTPATPKTDDEVDAVSGAAPVIDKKVKQAVQTTAKAVGSAVETIKTITTLAKNLTSANKAQSKPAFVKPAAIASREVPK